VIKYGHKIKGVTMEQSVLWGNTLADYRQMFDLDEAALLRGRLLEFASGATGVNAELTEQGVEVVSYDQRFKLPATALRDVTERNFEHVLKQVQQEPTHYQWQTYESPMVLAESRRYGIERFFEDYADGLAARRYMAGDEWMPLPFADASFDLVLSAQFFLQDNARYSLEWQAQMMAELCRVGRELRIFPLVDERGEAAQGLGTLMQSLQEHQLGVEVRQVDYHFVPNDNAMLRVWPLACDL
jgi:hypothetical protein